MTSFGHNFVDFTNEELSPLKSRPCELMISRTTAIGLTTTQHGASRAPVELIAHVVENDLPLYGDPDGRLHHGQSVCGQSLWGIRRAFNDDPRIGTKFKPSKIVSSTIERDEFYKDEYDPSCQCACHRPRLPARRTIRTRACSTRRSFLSRYPTTATNRNRARARWTYYHFLGLDVEKSASRTTDPVALADTNNPTMHNPACTVCHSVLDPVAGAFQDYGDDGFYKDQRGGYGLAS